MSLFKIKVLENEFFYFKVVLGNTPIAFKLLLNSTEFAVCLGQSEVV